jgi:hypothetical protein
MVRTGYARLSDRSDATFEEQYALEEIIEGSASAAPAVIVAKLSVALSRIIPSHREDFPWAMVRSVIANLRPSLPADMAAGAEALS